MNFSAVAIYMAAVTTAAVGGRKWTATAGATTLTAMAAMAAAAATPQATDIATLPLSRN